MTALSIYEFLLPSNEIAAQSVKGRVRGASSGETFRIEHTQDTFEHFKREFVILC